MASEKVILSRSAKAAADLHTDQYKIVKLGSGGTISLATAGSPGFVLQDKPKTAEFGTIALVGISKVIAGDTVTAGQYVSSNASGLAVPSSDDSSAHDGTKIVGQALEDASAGDLFEINVGAGLA